MVDSPTRLHINFYIGDNVWTTFAVGETGIKKLMIVNDQKFHSLILLWSSRPHFYIPISIWATMYGQLPYGGETDLNKTEIVNDQ